MFDPGYFDPSYFETPQPPQGIPRGDAPLVADSPYFSCDYFDPDYFDTDCTDQTDTGGRGGRVRGVITFERQPPEDPDELFALI